MGWENSLNWSTSYSSRRNEYSTDSGKVVKGCHFLSRAQKADVAQHQKVSDIIKKASTVKSNREPSDNSDNFRSRERRRGGGGKISFANKWNMRIENYSDCRAQNPLKFTTIQHTESSADKSRAKKRRKTTARTNPYYARTHPNPKFHEKERKGNKSFFCTKSPDSI